MGLELGTIITAGSAAVPSAAAWSVPAALAASAAVGLALWFALLMRRRLRRLERQAEELAGAKADLAEAVATLNETNRELRHSEARYRGLVDGHGDVLLRKAPDGRLTFVNDIFCLTFGVERDTVLGSAFHPPMHPDKGGSMLGTLGGGGAGPLRVRYDQHLKTVDGWRWFAWEDFPVRDGEGRLLEIQSMGRDITDRKETEEALTRARDMAEAASRSKSLFLATMSHEIRTPMNGILGMTGLMLSGPLTPTQRHYAEMVQESGEALLSLINDILDYSKIESGAVELEPLDFDPVATVEAVAELLATRAHGKGIAVATVVAPDTPARVCGDEARLRQVLLNLVGNAIKFTDRGGVTLTLRPDPEDLADGTPRLRFEIADTGIGVAEEARERIFDMFAQADSSHARKFGGTGLGLAISKRIVEAMGGRIGVDSAPGRGSTFWFTAGLDWREPRPAASDGPLAGQHVLIVSSSGVLREAVARQIHLDGGRSQVLEGTIASAVADLQDPPGFTALLIDDESTEPTTLRSLSPLKDARILRVVTPEARDGAAGDAERGFHGMLVTPLRRERLHDALLRPSDGPAPESMSPPTRAAALGPPPNPTIAAEGSGSGLRVLLAEDNEINAILAISLLRRAGHAVERVASGADVMPALEKGRFDLVLMDVHMPGTDGLEATRAVRAEPRYRDLPVIALTANAMPEDRVRCLEAGMNDFLTKPMTPDMLYAMVRKWAVSPVETGPVASAS